MYMWMKTRKIEWMKTRKIEYEHWTNTYLIGILTEQQSKS